MMKTALPLIMALILSACASSDGSVEKVTQPKNATSLMLTDADTAAVAECMARLLKTTAVQETDGYSITPSTEGKTTYHVVAFTDPLNRYRTRIDMFGQNMNVSGPPASICLHPEHTTPVD